MKCRPSVDSRAAFIRQIVALPICLDRLHLGQILASVLVRQDHSDQCQDGDEYHVVCRSNRVARGADQGKGDVGSGTAEDGVSQVEAQRETGVTHIGRERLAQVAGQRTVVDGEQQAHNQLNDKDGEEVQRIQQPERGNGEDHETSSCGDEHLLAAELIGDATGKEDEADVDDQHDGGDDGSLR